MQSLNYFINTDKISTPEKNSESIVTLYWLFFALSILFHVFFLLPPCTCLITVIVILWWLRPHAAFTRICQQAARYFSNNIYIFPRFFWHIFSWKRRISRQILCYASCATPHRSWNRSVKDLTSFRSECVKLTQWVHQYEVTKFVACQNWNETKF